MEVGHCDDLVVQGHLFLGGEVGVVESQIVLLEERLINFDLQV
jgi:hypothetical protein